MHVCAACVPVAYIVGVRNIFEIIARKGLLCGRSEENKKQTKNVKKSDLPPGQEIRHLCMQRFRVVSMFYKLCFDFFLV